VSDPDKCAVEPVIAAASPREQPPGGRHCRARNDAHSRRRVGPSDDGERPGGTPKRALIPPEVEQLNRLAHAGYMRGVARWAGNCIEVNARSGPLTDELRAMVTGCESQVVLAFAERCLETDHGTRFS
jgi:hypothetical protein